MSTNLPSPHDEKKPVDFTNWFIGIGVIATIVAIWFANGQPGRPLTDGDYGCSAGTLLTQGGPGATVQDGKVVDVWDFDMRTGARRSLSWGSAERKGPNEFRVTSQNPLLPGGAADTNYVCTHE